MNDIAHAPEWFHEAINQRPQEKILDHINGNISYAFWKAKTSSDSLIVLVHGTGAHKKWWYPFGPKLNHKAHVICLLYTSPSPRDRSLSRMPSSA